jgi:hypothetical protein
VPVNLKDPEARLFADIMIAAEHYCPSNENMQCAACNAMHSTFKKWTMTRIFVR